jgi:hypothetical protein
MTWITVRSARPEFVRDGHDLQFEASIIGADVVQRVTDDVRQPCIDHCRENVPFPDAVFAP